MDCSFSSLSSLSHPGKSASRSFDFASDSFYCSKILLYLLNLNINGCTGRSWGTVESDDLVEVVIFFGGFAVGGLLFCGPCAGSDDVVVMILSSAVVHVSD